MIDTVSISIIFASIVPWKDTDINLKILINHFKNRFVGRRSLIVNVKLMFSFRQYA